MRVIQSYLCENTEMDVTSVILTMKHNFELRKQLVDYIYHIPDEFISNDTPKGRELEPHITIKYGLKNHNHFMIAQQLAEFDLIQFIPGRTGFFDNKTPDGIPHRVLNLQINSDQLKEVNKKLEKSFEHVTTYEYVPHLTLAYLKAEPETNKLSGQIIVPRTIYTETTIKIKSPNDVVSFYDLKTKKLIRTN